MIVRILPVCIVVCTIIASGCNHQRPFPAFNMGAARIAPPGTGSLRTGSVAQAPNDYYNPGAGAVLQPPGNNGANSQNGWHPAGASTTGTRNTTAFNVPAQPASIPSNNVVVASTTSNLQTGTSTRTAQLPPTPHASSVGGGMPLNDATRATSPPGTNQLSGTFEYTSRPGLAPYRVAGPPVVNSGNAVMSTSTTGNQFNRPRFNGYPTNGYPNTGNDWRARNPNVPPRQ